MVTVQTLTELVRGSRGPSYELPEQVRRWLTCQDNEAGANPVPQDGLDLAVMFRQEPRPGAHTVSPSQVGHSHSSLDCLLVPISAQHEWVLGRALFIPVGTPTQTWSKAIQSPRPIAFDSATGQVQLQSDQAKLSEAFSSEADSYRFIFDVSCSRSFFLYRRVSSWSVIIKLETDKMGLVVVESIILDERGAVVSRRTSRTRCSFCDFQGIACQCPRSLWERSRPIARSGDATLSWSSWANNLVTTAKDCGRTHSVFVDGVCTPTTLMYQWFHSSASECQNAVATMVRITRAGDRRARGSTNRSASLEKSTASPIGSDIFASGSSSSDGATVGSASCTICGRTFSTSSHLSRHRRSIHGSLIFSCEECSRTFNQRGNLSRHVALVHRQERRWRCRRCGRAFVTKQNLERHSARPQCRPVGSQTCE
mmetsp:Transcript_15508/g.31359  ORF Transcript_15508/g.31359 Transcript_15508/m.31359 type:complete len:425 (+) Transcript_15508:350-1624(+)